MGDVVGWVLRTGANLGTLFIYVTVGAAVFTAWKRTLGRPRALARILTSLATNMQTDFFVEQLGTPAFRRVQDDSDDMVWVHPDALVRAVGVDGTVMVYAVTTRRRRFAPTFMRKHRISLNGDTLEVTLGRTRFGELPFGPDQVYGDTAARRQGYLEVYNFGNPGGYQTYVYALSDAGWLPADSGDLVTALASHGSVDARRTDDTSTSALPSLPADVATARTHAAFNTFAIIDPGWRDRIRDLGFTPGPDADLVRLAQFTRGLSWADSIRLWFRRRGF